MVDRDVMFALKCLVATKPTIWFGGGFQMVATHLADRMLLACDGMYYVTHHRQCVDLSKQCAFN